MKKLLRVISVIMSILLLVVSHPVYANAYARGPSAIDIGTFYTDSPTGNLYYGDVMNRQNDLTSFYLQPGKYWNHYGVSESSWGQGNLNVYTTTDTPCPHHSGTRYGVTEVCDSCNWYCGKTQCYGFAWLFAAGVFGTQPGASDWTVKYYGVNELSFDDLRIGDYARFDDYHSFVVTYIGDDYISTVNCNWGARCRIDNWQTNSDTNWSLAELRRHSWEIRHCTRNLSTCQPDWVTVTFKVKNGTWNDGTTSDKTMSVYRASQCSFNNLDNPFPEVGSKPASGYKAGSWDITPTIGMPITDNTTFTYTYETANVSVTGITLNQSSISIKDNETYQLSAAVSPSNATNKNITWTSSNTAVATVSSAGLVTAVSAGTSTITAAASDGSGKNAVCAVTVQSSTETNNNLIDFSQFKAPEGCVYQYRLYNPNTGEHFYTGSQEETLNLVKAGWNFEGSGFIAPTVGIPIYRLFSKEHNDHFYTTSETERDALLADHWTLDGDTGIAFPSADISTGRPMFRVHNPNAYPNGEAGAHHFTMSWEEVQNLTREGWEFEGIAWYSV